MGEALKLLQYSVGSSPSPINCMGGISATILLQLHRNSGHSTYQPCTPLARIQNNMMPVLAVLKLKQTKQNKERLYLYFDHNNTKNKKCYHYHNRST